MTDCERLARTSEIPADWADRLALEIALDMQRMGTRAACGLTAARLRLVRAEGEAKGLDVATGLIAGIPAPKSFTARDAAVLREGQLDHDQERAHGWVAE